MFVFVFAIFISRKIDVSGFFVNNRKTGIFLSTASIVSTNVGAGTYVGVASAGAGSGISYAFMAILVILLGFSLLAYFAPRIARYGAENNAFTISDFLSDNYGVWVGVVGSLTTIAVYIFFLAAQFLALGLMVQIISGTAFYSALIFSVIGLILYTVISGAKSDIYTDAVHFVFMSAILVLVLLPSVIVSGGGIASIAAKVPETFFDVIAFGGMSFLVLAVIFGAPTLLVSMDMWQRIYSAASPAVARKAMIWAAIINVPILTIPALVGLYVKATTATDISNPDQAFFLAMIEVLPVGFLGLGLASALAAFMSTANTMIMVLSASIYKDLFCNLTGREVEGQSLAIARIVTACVGIIGILIAYAIPSIVQLTLNAFFSLMVLAPAILGAFFWKKSQSGAAFWSILVGSSITWALLPFAPKMAFLPGVIASIVIFVAGTALAKR